MSKRKQHAPEFKAKVALEALKGEGDRRRAGEPVRGASDDDPSMEAALLDGASGVFERGGRKGPRSTRSR